MKGFNVDSCGFVKESGYKNSWFEIKNVKNNMFINKD